MEKYELGICEKCKEAKPLRNGYCIDCQNEIGLPDFFKDIFNEDKL